jgi:CBS domain-containing protein
LMVLFARDIVVKDFLSLPPTTNAFEASKLMKANHQGFVVVSKQGLPVGVVTEWDYLSKIVAEGKDPAAVKLEEIMSSGLVTVPASEGLEDVARIMTEKGVRRLIVMHEGTVLGVVTSRTILARLEEYIDQISTTIARLQAPPL